MANDLQEQLMKAGLVSAQKVKQANTQRRKKKKQERKTKTETVDESKIAAEKAREAKIQRDRELNQAKHEENQKKEIQAQIKDLILRSQIAEWQGDIQYNFNVSGTIKSIYLDSAIQKQVIAGQIAIVHHNDSFTLVPKNVAEKIAQRDDSHIALLNTRSEDTPSDEDDPYADYQIPDDLMW